MKVAHFQLHMLSGLGTHPCEHRRALGSSVVEGLCWAQGRIERQTTPMKYLPSISTYRVGKTSQRCTKNSIQCKFVQWYKTHRVGGEDVFFPAIGIRVSSISRVQLLDALETDYPKENRVNLTGVNFWMPRFNPLSKFGQLFAVYNLGRRLFLPLSVSDNQVLGTVIWPKLSQSGSPAHSIANGSTKGTVRIDSWCLWWYPLVFSGGSSSIPVIIPAIGWLLWFFTPWPPEYPGFVCLFVSTFCILSFSLPLILWTSMNCQQSSPGWLE